MQFSKFRHFARTSSGQLDARAIKALGLPMDDDVMEQFVVDHGLNDHFQDQYCAVDLYSIEWKRARLSVDDLLGGWSKFDQYVTEVANIAEKHVDDEPHPPHVNAESWDSWRNCGTWRRSPVFLDDGVLERPGLHLVEGHTRVGMLKGLLRTHVKVQPAHDCWLGRNVPTRSSIDWVSILERYPISFYHWLYAGAGESSLQGEVADKLLEAESALRYRLTFPENLDGLVELVAAAPECGVDVASLFQLTTTWRQELEECAGRPLALIA